ncbi:VOC family protein [uncultured Phenylobacterium sp.]|uniref:VOC family protein n=1 Tax=uncultured Phenylobacterium sp. TaxID=349273 RepID=UPI0025D3E173|nr:VOC family protein [uncultured Phenylobacterium sp.]
MADDLARARGFYKRVFGWTFEPGGPPDFLLMTGAGIGGALNLRHTQGGRALDGLDLTFAVGDIRAATAAVEAGGGTILLPEYDLVGVGRMIAFADTEGNTAKACQYERAWTSPPRDGAGVFRHFSINADDIPRARGFYERLFGWTFEPWGPPDFFQAVGVGQGHSGSLQGRRSIGGHVMPGIEITVGVDDLTATQAAIAQNGGTAITPPFQIGGVGELIYFQDSEGNIAGAMQYEAVQWPA